MSIMIYTVTVGKNAHRFDPEVVYAGPGDTVTFQFFPAQHSVVRAQFGYPCIPYENVKAGNGTQFFSGMHYLNEIMPDPPTFNVTVNDTAPIFYYCSAPGSCNKHGMVGVVNPNATETFQAQQSVALLSQYVLQPGENFPDEDGSPLSLPAPDIPGAPVSSTAFGLSTTYEPSTVSSAFSISTSNFILHPDGLGAKNKVSAGPAVGITLSAVILLIGVALVIWRLARRKEAAFASEANPVVRTQRFYVHGGQTPELHGISSPKTPKTPTSFSRRLSARHDVMTARQGPVVGDRAV